ncbi:MAG TPA: glycogen debranching N-terminal domain-containing protein, partial [Kofleriaceae bacterium]|nr:glycogen debranching N-terminal domain-containing protein [Kofleriaceae bacterium]
MAVKDVIRIQDAYYILAPAAQPDNFRLVLKQGDSFAVFDRVGDLHTAAQLGLFHGDTRFLSRLELRVHGQRPLLLSSSVNEDNVLLTADLTNPDLPGPDQTVQPRDVVHILRSVFLGDAACYLVLHIRNYGGPMLLPLHLRFAADFADIFEIRGTQRAAPGELAAPEVDGDRVRLAYLGRDGRRRRTTLRFEPAPDELAGDGAAYQLQLAPGAELTIRCTITCDLDGQERRHLSTEAAWDHVCREAAAEAAQWCQVWTDNAQFNEWVGRSLSDLRMMVTRTPSGSYPYAG